MGLPHSACACLPMGYWLSSRFWATYLLLRRREFACANVTKLEFIYGILHPINHHYNHQLFSPGPRDWFKRVM